jgi:nitrite reductase/ring-hydroxylating ferredoxin subunit
MPLRIHTLRRTDLAENGVLTFEVSGAHYVVADVDGDVQAFAVAGPAVGALPRAAVAEGHLRCPLHGWPIDPAEGRCGAAERCRYEPLAVEADAEEIRVSLPCP